MTLHARTKPYPAYRPSGVGWLGEIPAHWEVKRLKTIAEIRYGLGQPPRESPDGMPLVRATNVYRGHITDEDMLFVDPADVPAGRRAFLSTGDIVVVRSGAYTADSAIIPKKYEGAIAGYDMVVTVKEAKSEFIAAALLSPYIRDAQLIVTSARSAQPHLNAEELRDALVLLPPLPEQRAIADFLDRETTRIDALVDKKERLIELLHEKRTALITRAVTRGLESRRPMKDSGIEWLGEIPAHWEVKRLAWLTECLDGQRVPLNAEERSDMNGEFPYWGANSIVDYVDRWLFHEDLVLLGEDGAPFFDRNRDVAFAVSGKIWVNNHAHVLRPRPAVYPRFLASVLNCVDYRVFIGGTTRDKLTQGDMNSIPIQFPSIIEQRAIAEFLDQETAKLDALVAKVREAVDRLRELRTALISAAVTGRIDVREEAG